MQFRRESAARGQGIPLVSSATTACMSPGMMTLKGGHSREANGVCDRERAQRFAVAKPCVTRMEVGKEEERCCARTKESQRWWRQCRWCSFKVG